MYLSGLTIYFATTFKFIHIKDDIGKSFGKFYIFVKKQLFTIWHIIAIQQVKRTQV